MEPTKRVISVQSHVVHGYVGNKAATFPLQLLGWDVDAINTVQFSNHAGYRSHGGSKTDRAQLIDLFSVLERNEFTQTDALLSGYIPGAEALSAMADFAAHLKTKNPNLLFILDPVMGDDGKLYVASDVLPIYRDRLLRLATVITPNWFEVEYVKPALLRISTSDTKCHLPAFPISPILRIYRLLTQIELTSRSAIRSALHSLHFEHGVRNVVISSVIVREGGKLSDEVSQAGLRSGGGFSVGDIPGDNEMKDEYILCVASSAPTDSDAQPITHALAVPRIKGYFSGVGDLFSALVLAHFTLALPPSDGGKPPGSGAKSASPLSRAASRALHSTHLVLRRTQKHALALASKFPENSSEATNVYTDDELDAQDPLRRVRRMRKRELRIIQSRDEILACASQNNEVEEMRSWEGFWDTP